MELVQMDERELVREARHARSLHAAPARLTAETMPRARGSFGCNSQRGGKRGIGQSLELQMKSHSFKIVYMYLSGMAPPREYMYLHVSFCIANLKFGKS